MQLLVVVGAIAVAGGLAGLGYCIVVGFAIRRDKPAPEASRARLGRLVTVNLGSVGLAGIGIAMIVVGLVMR